MPIDPRDIHPSEIADFVDRSFRPLAEQKGLGFSVDVELGVSRSLYTDPQRLQQVLKNLLANAFKFTAEGSVTLRIHRPGPRDRTSRAPHSRSSAWSAFSVSDTGIGIPEDKQGLIFEAFQQADGTTSRRYGGTGLGLTISRDIARHLGGEIQVESQPGQRERLHPLPARALHRAAGHRRRVRARRRLASTPEDRARRPTVRDADRPVDWPTSPAAGCWWSTTTSATSSP